MNDLHMLAEQRAGIASGTVRHVLGLLNESADFGALSPRTQKDYQAYFQAICARLTKMGVPFGDLLVDKLSRPVIQRLIEAIAQEGHPTKANHWLRYMHRSFKWAVNRGHCKTNPAAGVEQAKERGEVRVPTLEVYRRILSFAQDRGSLAARSPGSCAPYIAPIMQLAYLCRLRGIEVITLTDDHLSDKGVTTNRRKRSRDTRVLWTPELRSAVDVAIKLRDDVYNRHKRPIQLRPEDRPLIVSEDGEPLTRSGLDSAWQRFMRLAIAEGVITEDQRFGLHGLKHRGITDTEGTFGDKQLAGGHKSPSMTHRYDHSTPEVLPAGKKSDWILPIGEKIAARMRLSN